MGETIMELALHIAVVGFVFFMIISLRNKFEYSNEYGIFKKTDGLILMFVVYLFLFFTRIDINNLSIGYYYQFAGGSPTNSINWIPFSWISSQLELMSFYTFIERGRDYYTDFATIGLLKHFTRFILHLLPLSFFMYILTTNKWIGFVLAEIIGICVMLFNFRYFVTDGIVVICISYLIIAIIGYFMEKVISGDKYIGSKKKIELITSYSLAFIVILIGSIWVLDIDVHPNYDETLVGTIEVDEHYEFYDGLIALDLTHISLYKGGHFGENIKLNGRLNIDKSLYSYFGEGINNKVNVTYLYSFYDHDLRQGAHSSDFSWLDEEINKGEYYEFQRYVELGNYGKFIMNDKNEAERIEDDKSNKFFVFKGLSELEMDIAESDIDSMYDVIEASMGKDKYAYYDYTYKVMKFNGEDIDYYITPYGFKKNGDMIRFYSAEEKVIEETNDYKIINGKSYIYNFDEEEINYSLIELKVYRASILIGLDIGDHFLEFDENEFK